MKTVIIYFLIFFAYGLFNHILAQNLNSRSVEFRVDMSDPKNLISSSVPQINWILPINETTFLNSNKFHVKIEIISPDPIVYASLAIKDKSKPILRGSKEIIPEENEKYAMIIERNIIFPDGVNILELMVENEDGVQSKSFRILHVGETALADAAKLDRNDYALVFVTDKYENFTPLVNPIYDGQTISSTLEKYYGFQTEIVENPSQDEIFRKLREYSQKKYQPLDQLMVFFAGHGYFDETFQEGYVVVRESLKNDPGKTSYVSYNRLRNILNVIPCEHILLMTDVCFGGTFDNVIANRADDIYSEVSQSEFILRKLSVKTRKYLTSGGKVYVSDGIAGQHSPFARKIIEGLESFGGSDGILTLKEMYPYVEKLNPEPRIGIFGDDAPGSEFVFVVK